ncbi:MAG: right-handed parallel beta-helix repeat-containing protein [Planctomycetes bacterium]|nr:right-handed parallel beta-helix repeat-containing protein [Planctomycetota bacterium]MCC7171063.1 right-handed parallel beta-helix repeat-containing protein [Planctomycetota bacterium]
MRHAILTTLLCSFAASAVAAELKVPSALHQTIASAIAAAAPGDVVVIKPGTYSETVDISNTVGLSVIGLGKVVIDATGNTNGIVGNNVNFAWLQNLTVRNSTGRGIELTSANASLLRKLRVENAGDDGIKLASGKAIQLVECSTKIIAGDGFDLFAESCLVSKCVARESQNTGFRIDGNRNRIISCTVDSSLARGLSIGIDGTSNANSIANLRVKGQNATGIALGALADSNSLADVIISSCTQIGCSVGAGAQGNTFTKVNVTSTVGAGFFVGSDSNVFSSCTANKSQAEGFLSSASANENLFVASTAKNCAIGFSLAGDDNTVMRCKAQKCPNTVTEVGNPSNTYVDNSFLDPDTF